MIAVCFPENAEDENDTGFCEWRLPNDEIMTEHPRTLLDGEAFNILEAYMHYKNGFLPVSGGLMDQANYFLECMSCTQQWMNKNAKS